MLNEKTPHQIIVEAIHALSKSVSLNYAIKNFIQCVELLTSAYNTCAEEYKIQLGDYMIIISAISNWGLVAPLPVSNILSQYSTSVKIRNYDQSKINEIYEQLPHEVKEIMNISYPLDFPVTTAEEATQRDKIWNHISELLSSLKKKYLEK